jgi:hypothetical protein
MSYRPITDVWILARSKVKFYGAYPAGFLQRARDLIGCRADDVVLHVCAGKVREYPYSGVGEHDITMDLDPSTNPDYIADACEQASWRWIHGRTPIGVEIAGVLADPSYSDAEQLNYAECTHGKRPTPQLIVAYAIDILPVGGRVGVLSYEWPRYPKATARQVALVSVYVGNGNAGRTFAVYERIK